jgi:hypothetical protein
MTKTVIERLATNVRRSGFVRMKKPPLLSI